MKATQNHRFAFLLCSIIILTINASFCQNKLNAHIGYGFPDLLNLGLRFQLPQAQLGGSYGFLGEFRTLSFDVYAHFGGNAEFVDRRPWYVRTGVCFSKELLEGYTTKVSLLPIRFGRDLNFNEKMGLQVDFGAAILLSEKVTVHDSFYAPYANDPSGWYSVTPCLALSYFYRF